ncbi:hypothetical protein J6524_35865 [Bradyrhizobium sp. WSM 1738]|nr:hypothetical protein [Bradyrhizobium hereditatis]
METIKKDVIWWQTGAQAPQLLADGQVVMTTAWNGRIYDRLRTPARISRSCGITRRWGLMYGLFPRVLHAQTTPTS